MKLFYWLLPCLMCFLLLGCGEDETDSAPYVPAAPEFKSLINMAVADSVHPGRMAVRIAIQRTIDTDTTRMYKLISANDGAPVGINLVLPRKDVDRQTGNRGYFKSQGAASEALLQVLAKLYGLRIDSVEKFADSVGFDCTGLNDPAKKDALAPGNARLLFPQSDSAQLLIGIHPEDQFVDLIEKDTIYRVALINAFTQH